MSSSYSTFLVLTVSMQKFRDFAFKIYNKIITVLVGNNWRKQRCNYFTLSLFIIYLFYNISIIYSTKNSYIHIQKYSYPSLNLFVFETILTFRHPLQMSSSTKPSFFFVQILNDKINMSNSSESFNFLKLKR